MVNEIQVGRLNGVLTKLLSMKEGAPAPVLAPEILPGIILENDRPEFKFLGGTRLGIGGIQQDGGVGTIGIVALENPAGSGALIVVEDILLASASIGDVFNIFFTSATTGLTNTARAAHRDTRNVSGAGGNVGLSGRIMSGALAGVPGTGPQISAFRTQVPMALFKLELVLSPGFNLAVGHSVAVQSMWVTFRWYERALESSETR